MPICLVMLRQGPHFKLFITCYWFTHRLLHCWDVNDIVKDAVAGLYVVSTLTGSHKYKDQTDSKLPQSGLCTYIMLKTHVLQGRHGKGTQLNIGGFLLRQK